MSFDPRDIDPRTFTTDELDMLYERIKRERTERKIRRRLESTGVSCTGVCNESITDAACPVHGVHAFLTTLLGGAEQTGEGQ